MSWYSNWEDSEKIICPYCGETYEPSYEDTYIGGEPVDCYDETVQYFTCDKCKYKFKLTPYQSGFNYQTETIDGEITEEQWERLGGTDD